MKRFGLGVAAAIGVLAISACTTRETRIIQAPAVVGAEPGTSTTIIRSNRADAPVVIEGDEPRDILVHVD